MRIVRYAKWRVVPLVRPRKALTPRRCNKAFATQGLQGTWAPDEWDLKIPGPSGALANQAFFAQRQLSPQVHLTQVQSGEQRLFSWFLSVI